MLALAVGVAVGSNRTIVEVDDRGVCCRRPVRSFELHWEEIAGAIVARPSFAIRELVVVDAKGHFRQTGIWRWRIPRGHVESLSRAVATINRRSLALPGVAELGYPELGRALSEYSREALLRAAGLDERGAERRSDQMMGLWFLVLFGSAAVGGILAAALGGMLVFDVVMVAGVGGFLLWASRQPRLPPQRRAVRIGRRRS